MAQKVSVQLICDLHDEQDVEAAETALFGVDGSTYEIELCEDHGRELRAAVEPFAAAGRRSGAPPTASARAAAARGPRRARAASPAAAPAGGGQQSAIREWARAHGHAVSDRGRLSAAVTAAYNAAH